MTTQAASKWMTDLTHSEVEFKVQHLMISTVTGKFTRFTAEAITNGEDFSSAKINFNAETASIQTGSEQRDGHLKSDDFFNAEQFPNLVFKSRSVERKSDKQFVLHGDLTIRDITKSVTLDVVYHGIMTDPYGQVKAGFEVHGKINRKEFGLKWSSTTEAGGLVLSDEVRITSNIQLIKQA